MKKVWNTFNLKKKNRGKNKIKTEEHRCWKQVGLSPRFLFYPLCAYERNKLC